MSNRQSTASILCLSHLNWDHVWQRPHQILWRLARDYPVLYVHEPRIEDSSNGVPRLMQVATADRAQGNGSFATRRGSGRDLTAWQPLFPNSDRILESWRETYADLVERLWNEHKGRERALILWFYTPLPVYVLDHLPADVVVYDVMDDLASFRHAPEDMPEREAKLLERADVVFAGGRSLYEKRKGRHSNLHLFPSGVDPDHFARALDPSTPIAAEIASLPRPILGYYGVIDERIDLELVRQIAIERPGWSVVLVGPPAKIDDQVLPWLPNLHYLGIQPYERLPTFLKAFDVCLMPFALNEATRAISPTKTLEYMAAHKPIVSTPVPDVVANWGDVVSIASDPGEFVAAIESALDEPESERARREIRECRHVHRSGWDRIVAEMRATIEAALAQKV